MSGFDGQVIGHVQSMVIPDEERVLSQIVGQEHLLDKLAHSDGFVAGQWCATKEQKDFYKHELDCGPMVSDWVDNGYRVPMDSWPKKRLSA